MAHAARVLSEDSPAAPAVEQGRVTVSDASRVMDEPAEVQLRALERVTGGGSRNLAGAAQGLPPGGWIAEVGEVIGGAGLASWRVWQTPARGVSPAGADMGGGAAVVVSGPDVGAGHPGGWLGPSQGWISSSPRSGCGVGSVARGGRHPVIRLPCPFSTVGDNNAAENGFPGLELRARGPGGLIVPGGWRF